MYCEKLLWLHEKSCSQITLKTLKVTEAVSA